MGKFAGPFLTNMGQSEWDIAGPIFSDTGLLYGGRNMFAPTAGSGMHINIASGVAWVESWLADNSDSSTAVVITTADPSNPRIDRVVAHIDRTTKTLTMIALAGTPGVSPSPPALTATSLIWEYSICQVRVNAGVTSFSSGDITDERAYLNTAANPNWTFPGGGAFAGLLYTPELVVDGPITEIGSLVSAGNLGAAVVVGRIRGQAGSGTTDATILSTTAPTDGDYRVGCSFRVGTTGTVTVKVTYTDPGGSSRTAYIEAQESGATSYSTMSSFVVGSTGYFASQVFQIPCKSGTAITFTGKNTNGGGSDTYNVVIECVDY